MKITGLQDPDHSVGPSTQASKVTRGHAAPPLLGEPRVASARMARRRLPRGGDVIIRAVESGRSPCFALSSAIGPDQIRCRTHAEAQQLALAYAARAGVSVWVHQGADAFRMVATFGEGTRPEPGSRRSGSSEPRMSRANRRG
jgi:hypothetical protein